MTRKCTVRFWKDSMATVNVTWCERQVGGAYSNFDIIKGTRSVRLAGVLKLPWIYLKLRLAQSNTGFMCVLCWHHDNFRLTIHGFRCTETSRSVSRVAVIETANIEVKTTLQKQLSFWTCVFWAELHSAPPWILPSENVASQNNGQLQGTTTGCRKPMWQAAFASLSCHRQGDRNVTMASAIERSTFFL